MCVRTGPDARRKVGLCIPVSAYVRGRTGRVFRLFLAVAFLLFIQLQSV